MSDWELLDELLQDGRVLIAPSREHRAALDRLVAASLVRVSTTSGFTCFDPRDEACWNHPTRACSAWVPCPDEALESFAPVCCPACGLEHEPAFDHRALSTASQVYLVDDGVIAWMDSAVHAMDTHARRLRQGVGWELERGADDLEVVWLDASADTRVATRAYATARPVVYVVTSARAWSGRFDQDPWLKPVPLATWLSRGPDAISEAMASRRAPTIVTEPAMRPWSASRTLDETAVTVPLGARCLVLEGERATLDGHEVIAREGVAVLALLRVLVERWREDVGAGKVPADFCTWTPDELRDAMVDTQGQAPDTATLRRQLNRLRSGVRERYQQATGLALDDDAVVENVPGQGYRLNPQRVLAVLP